MVNDQAQDSRRTPVNRGVRARYPKANKIGAATPYDFDGRNLTAYGGLLPVGTMLEKLGFQQVVEENVREPAKHQLAISNLPSLMVGRKTRAMMMYRFVLAMVLACYVGFSRLYHLRFLKREPTLTGILHVVNLPP